MSNENDDKNIANAVLYTRTSSMVPTERETSAQIEVLLRYCKTRNIAVVGAYIERARAGDDQPPVLRQMVEDVLSPSSNVDGILILNASRLGRNANSAAELRAKLLNEGIRVIAVTDDAERVWQLAERFRDLLDQYERDVKGAPRSTRSAGGCKEEQ